MRTLYKPLCLAASITLFFTFSSKGQCSNNLFQTIRYDSTVIGGCEDYRIFTIPQFDPSIGTLVSAKINARVSIAYGFTLKNTDLNTRSITISVGRNDQISSSALTSDFNNSTMTTVGTYLVNSGSTVSQPLSTILYRSNETDSITSSVVNFLGVGNLEFDYSPITYTSLNIDNGYEFTASGSDTVNFSVTYYYCNSSILANDLISFTANKQNDGKVKLNWSSVGPQVGRIYEVQACADSSHFVSVGSVSGENNQSDYQYYYNIPTGASGKIYFRVKVIDVSGKFQYSEIRWVDVSTANNKAAYIFPNPSDSYINLVLNDPSNTDWETSIYAADGALIQKNHFGRNSLMHISFNNKLATGTYFLKARAISTNKQQLFSFMVQ